MNNDITAIPPQNTAVSIPTVDSSAVAIAEMIKASIQSSYTVAWHKPRDKDAAKLAIIDYCRKPSFAAVVEYRLPVGKIKNDKTGQWEPKYITGPTIDLMELIISKWENIRVESHTVYDGATSRIVLISVTDLESNTSYSTEIVVEKSVERSSSKDRDVMSTRTNSYGDTVYIVKPTEGEIKTKVAAELSKAIRTLSERLIPKDIIDAAIEQARFTCSERDSKDPDKSREDLFTAFSMIGITVEQIRKYLGHNNKNLQPKELEDLRTIYGAIKSGLSTWSELTDLDERDVNGETKTKTEAKLDEVKAKLAEEKAKKEADKKAQDQPQLDGVK